MPTDIDTLKARLDALESRVAELETGKGSVSIGIDPGLKADILKQSAGHVLTILDDTHSAPDSRG